MGFSYLRDRGNGFDRALWNCGQFKRADPAQCMRGRGTLTAVPAPAATPRGPSALPGVRRAADAVPKEATAPAGEAAPVKAGTETAADQ
jgi:hypothetical protein